MRVLQIVNVGVEAGGAEKSVRIIAEGLRARGHEALVLTTDHLLDGSRESFADEVVPAPRGGAAARLSGYFWNRPAYARTRRIVADFRPDCVHLHTIGEFSPAVLAATRSVPTVLTLHGPEDWTLRLLRWNLASASGGALSLPDRARYLYLRFMQRPAYLFWLRRIDRIIAPSEYFAAAVRPDAGRVPIRVLANGIEQPPEPAAGREEPADPHLALYAGRLAKVKGVHILIEAVRKLHARGVEVRLDIVGDGEERARLEQQAADLVGADVVRFRGWQAPGSVSASMARAGAVVIPSLWPENFPTVALEALQLGRPLVVSRVGGLPELVGDDNGALVEAGDSDQLAQALAAVLGDEDRQCLLGQGARKRARAYEVGHFLDEVIACYREISR